MAAPTNALQLKRFHRYGLPFFAASIALWVAYGLLNRTWKEGTSLSVQAERLGKHFAHKETDLLQDLRAANHLLPAGDSSSHHARYRESLLFVFVGDSLVQWTTNRVAPDQLSLVRANGKEVIRLENGYYAVNCRVSGDTLFTGLFQVHTDFDIANEYLDNHFIGVDATAAISIDSISGAVPVKGLNGRLLFFVTEPEKAVATRGPAGLAALLFISLFVTLLFVNRLATGMRNRWIGLAVLAGAGLITLWLVLDALRPQMLDSLRLFDPQVYATPAYARSLGDLVFGVAVSMWVAVFFFRQMRFRVLSSVHRTVALVIANGATTFLLVIITDILRTLVLDSSVSFDVRNILSLNLYSLIGLVCVAMMFIGLFLIAFRFNAELNQEQRLGKRLALALFGVVLGLIPGLLLYHQLDALLVVPGAIVLGIIVSESATRRVMLISFNAIVLLLAFFSFYAARAIDIHNHEREDALRVVYAEKLLETNDPVLEYLFSEARDDIKTDNLIRSYLRNPVVSSRSVVDRLTYIYIGDQLNRYEVRVLGFAADTSSFRLLSPDSLDAIRRIIGPDGSLVNDDQLFRVDAAGGSFEYWAIIHVLNEDGSSLGHLVVQLHPKLISYSTVYPELLLDGDLRSQNEFDNLEFGIYSNGILVRRSGDFPYRLIIPGHAVAGQYTLEQEGYKHLVYTVPGGLTVWVSQPEEPWIEPISLFSYVFSIFLLVTFVSVIIVFLRKLAKTRFKLARVIELTFRSKIQLAVTLIIIVSFLLIGTLTVTNITRQYEVYHGDRLMRKVKQVLTGMELQYGPDSLHAASEYPLESGLAETVRNLSITHTMDLNIYSHSGRLVVSSQPAIFDKGLVSKLIDPVAFNQLVTERRSQYVQTERIGELNYLSAYVPINERNGQFTEILNLPYFAKEKDLRNEISDFLVYFVDVYVLLLLMAGLVAVIVSKSITRPLQVIGSKLKLVQLGKPNAPIHWRGEDEIGQLVREYNKMITEIERSAELLARSERESAWREMAQQVAHEIKNPLTPMKLSIQHLQRAEAENQPHLKQLVQKVSETLIEQIENLSRIASEFSSFATMPRAEKEVMDLHDTLRSVVTLYERSESEVVANIPDQSAMIFADKGQISRVFNNLIKNAIQAIPEERVGIVELTSIIHATEVTVSIADNGIGIPPEQVSKVFVPNFTTKTSGMGLGLAIAKSITESSGGRIWFDSVEGVGTEFFVTLPLVSGKP